VYIDSNLDGIDDYVLLNTNFGVFYGASSDVFISPIYRILPDGSLVATDFTFWSTLQPPTVSPGLDAAPYNSSVMFQAVGVTKLNLARGQTRIRYHVETLARDADRFGRVVDRVPSVGALEYDIAHPAIAPVNPMPPTLVQRPVFVDIGGGQISGSVDTSLLVARGGQKLLLLHHHNLPAQQAEVVDIRSSAPGQLPAPSGLFRSFVPLINIP
jgi:hypothetical protein